MFQKVLMKIPLTLNPCVLYSLSRFNGCSADGMCQASDQAGQEMKIRYKIAVAAAAIAMGFTGVGTNSEAQAGVINYGFTVDVTSGANVGQYKGSLSYDDSTLTRTGSENVGRDQGLSILFNYLGTTYTEDNDTGSMVGLPVLSFNNGNLLGLNYLVDNEFYISDHLGFPYTGGAKFYNNLTDDGNAGTQVGTVSYSESKPVPENNTIVGAVAVTAISLLMKRKQAKSIKVKA